MIHYFQVPPRTSPQMTAQISLDAQLEAVNSSFADFAQFPESNDVSSISFTFDKRIDILIHFRCH